MHILIATSEAVPFAKTGGLADVAGALPIALSKLGHHVTLMLPAYRSARECGLPIQPSTIEFSFPMGARTVSGRLLETRLPDSDVTVYLVEQDDYYDRDGLYRSGNEDYKDNCERYVFFCRAVLETIQHLDQPVDVLHANDWQTGLLPAYLKIDYRGVPGYEQIATLLTIHNMAYQGQFWHWDMLLTGLDWKYFNWQQLEFFGKLNLLKAGLVFADAINTVSPRYAEEIQGSEHGCGLEGVLQQRRAILSGITNGVDYSFWNPATDPHIAQQYDEATFPEGKAACKAALQASLGLSIDPRTPLVGLVGRLVEQKGIDLVTRVMQDWVHRSNIQWAILGTGEPKYEQQLLALAERFSSLVSVRLDFSDPLAHQIEAGADIFLMPSRFEPCGLNQLYSLKYGTVPVVRSTGGLADTVTDTNDQTLAAGSATGFAFHDYSTLGLSEALRRAIDTYESRPEVWHRLQETGMRQDWSWNASARKYAELYERLLTRTRQAVRT